MIYGLNKKKKGYILDLEEELKKPFPSPKKIKILTNKINGINKKLRLLK